MMRACTSRGIPRVSQAGIMMTNGYSLTWEAIKVTRAPGASVSGEHCE